MNAGKTTIRRNLVPTHLMREETLHKLERIPKPTIARLRQQGTRCVEVEGNLDIGLEVNLGIGQCCQQRARAFVVRATLLFGFDD